MKKMILVVLLAAFAMMLSACDVDLDGYAYDEYVVAQVEADIEIDSENETIYTCHYDIYHRFFPIRPIDTEIDTIYEIYEHAPEQFRFSHTVTKLTNDDMPKFMFEIEGVYAPEFLQQTSIVRQITIFSICGEFSQVLSGFYSFTHAGENMNYGVSFFDFNFDGYLDLILWLRTGSRDFSTPSLIWFWCTDTNMFVINEQLVEVSMNSFVTADSDLERVISSVNIIGGGNHDEYFKYIDGCFVLVKTRTDAHPRHFDEDKIEANFNRVVVRELINGEMVITKDSMWP